MPIINKKQNISGEADSGEEFSVAQRANSDPGGLLAANRELFPITRRTNTLERSDTAVFRAIVATIGV